MDVDSVLLQYLISFWLKTDTQYYLFINLLLIYYLFIIYCYAMVIHSQGLKISKSKNVCPEWLRWGLGN